MSCYRFVRILLHVNSYSMSYLSIVIALKLLQIWAWERLIRIAPSRRQVVAPGEVPIGQGAMQLPAGPRGSWWRGDMGHEIVSTHVIVVYRDQLDRMIEGEV